MGSGDPGGIYLQMPADIHALMQYADNVDGLPRLAIEYDMRADIVF